MQNAEVVEDYIGTAEAAEILDIDRSNVIRRVRSGDLKPVTSLPGRTGSHLFRRADVLALKTAPTVSAGPQATSPGDGGGSPTSDAA